MSPLVVFEACLVPSGRKALTLDADGEAILTLAVPASDAMKLVAIFPALMDTSFRVTLTRPSVAKTVKYGDQS